MAFFRVFFIFLVALAFMSGCEKKQPDVRPENLILISIDTLRTDRLGCYAYQKPTSPALDQIAAEGVLFENMYSTSPWTLPAHMSLFTGLYPSRHGVKSRKTKLPDSIPTLGSVLSEHDFAVGGVINYIFLDQRYGFAKGFGTYEPIPESQTPEGAASTINSWAEKLIRNRPPNKRFFLFLHYFDTHSDYTPKSQYKEQFAAPYQGIADGTTQQLFDFILGRVSLSQRDIDHCSDLYDAEIRQLDDELSQLFQLLEEQGLLKQTLLIITSDHGEEFLDHGGILHGRTQYQEIIRVPFIMSGPGIPKSLRIKGNCSIVDIMPTVLGILGIEPPDSLDGIDLQPTWEGSNSNLPSRFIFSEADHLNKRDDIKRAVLNRNYKLHHNLLTGKSELYNLAEDPNEEQDLAEKNPYTVNLLRNQLKQFMLTENKGQPLGDFSPEEINRLKGLGYLR